MRYGIPCQRLFVDHTETKHILGVLALVGDLGLLVRGGRGRRRTFTSGLATATAPRGLTTTPRAANGLFAALETALLDRVFSAGCVLRFPVHKAV